MADKAIKLKEFNRKLSKIELNGYKINKVFREFRTKFKKIRKISQTLIKNSVQLNKFDGNY